MAEKESDVVSEQEVGHDAVGAENGTGVDRKSGKRTAQRLSRFVQYHSPFYRVSWKDEGMLSHECE